ncbi:sensor histidine kinase [Erythrobacter sp. HA6-11]
MAVLPFRPTPFFANKNRAFWNLQLAGWGGAFLLRASAAIANSQPLDLLAVILVTTITGFSITLVLSVIYRQLFGRQPFVTWSMTMIVLVLAVIVHASIDAWVQGIYYAGASETTFAQRFIGLSYIPATLLVGWSALYYAINFFLTVEEQADRLERLEAQATSAQLAMLRYQLNPHFLFNTLNSISTLVLLKQTEPANAMLTRLSAFLRHTLITEPGSQVTLEQEVETLQLYLGIERMRFEERLRTHFEISDEAMQAQLPSMLLQPLIENAIKYAVSPQEEGARISLVAEVSDGRLKITVEDTGPGIFGDAGYATSRGDLLTYAAAKSDSTGVGLANIRSRLAQAYGDSHRFETLTGQGGGFTVLIEIPYDAEIKQEVEQARNPKSEQPEALPSPADQASGEPSEPATAPPLQAGRPIGSNA